MICTCRDPLTLGVVHRADAPCYYPEQREWQGLTDEEIDQITKQLDETAIGWSTYEFARAIEAKLKEKNN